MNRAAHSRTVLVALAYALIAAFFCYHFAPYFPSMDGPAHFYNATLLKEFFLGNETVKQHFSLTGWCIPNVFSTYAFAALLVLLPFKVAALLFFFAYYFLALFSARYLIRSFSVPMADLYALFITVLFNSLLISLGFFNFSWSAVFLCVSLGYYKRYLSNSARPLNLLVFLLLLLLVYYTNALAFLFLAVCAGLSEVFELPARKRKGDLGIKDAKRSLSVMGCFLLPAVMLLVFSSRMLHNSEAASNDFRHYLSSLTEMSSTIVYNVPEETAYTFPVFVLTGISFLLSLGLRIFQKEVPRASDVFLLVAVISLLLYFLVPDGWGVGMFSPRLQYYFFFFLFIWISLQRLPFFKLMLFAGIIIISWKKHNEKHRHALADLNASAHDIIRAADIIPANSVVLPLNSSGNWLMPHFSNYLGVEKPLIILENYEAELGWFPLRWNYGRMPRYVFGDQTLKGSGPELRVPDFVLVYGTASPGEEIVQKLEESYRLVYSSANKFVSLYGTKLQK